MKIPHLYTLPRAGRGVVKKRHEGTKARRHEGTKGVDLFDLGPIRGWRLIETERYPLTLPSPPGRERGLATAGSEAAAHAFCGYGCWDEASGEHGRVGIGLGRGGWDASLFGACCGLPRRAEFHSCFDF